jgi:sarcosine oxidase/L-pipecolate oxidase
MQSNKDSRLLIIGAGVFGLSTALELKLRGYKNVTVADRYLAPVKDGSSVDVSRVIRTDYADELYHRMAREAYKLWKEGIYREDFHETGFVMLAERSGQSYLDSALEVNEAQGVVLDNYPDANDARKLYPSIQAKLDGLRAVHNPNGGWADAEAAMRRLAGECSKAGVSFVSGPGGTVASLRYKSKDGREQVVGVEVASGDHIEADQVILCTGAWTNRLVPLSHATSASGQPVGFITLTEEETARLNGLPVMINLSTGIFCFPPTPGTNLLKIARHGYGWATEVQTRDGRVVSSPRLDGNGAESSYLPDDAEKALREGLQQLLPDFADHPWSNRRLCWYSDTPDGDFIIDQHPDIEGLFIASGGSGQ